MGELEFLEKAIDKLGADRVVGGLEVLEGVWDWLRGVLEVLLGP